MGLDFLSANIAFAEKERKTHSFFRKNTKFLEVAAAGSFAPNLQFADLEIHKACLRSANLTLKQDLPPAVLARLGIAYF